jgi:geranylgeranyl pyrophosphate synthase
MSTAATLSRLFAPIDADLDAVDRLFRERATSGLGLLNDASLHILGSRGKRLRTALTLFVGRLFMYHRERLLPLGAGFEMLHLASLVHDDIIDRADTRRGLATVNARFGNDIAILLGDYYFAKTAGLIADVNDNRIDRLFSDTVATIVEGTIMELLDAHQLDLSVERYHDRISRKTACLLAGCCKGGAIVCEATDPEIAQMYDFGLNLGMAFQIIDDVLDYAGAEAVIGKPAGNDLRQGMVTLPLIRALQADHNGYLASVRAIVEDPDRHQNLVPAIVSWVNDGAGIEQAVSEAREYAVQARTLLYSLPPSPARDTLDGLIDFVLVRER